MFQIFLLFSNAAIAIVRILTGADFLWHGLRKAKNFKGTLAWFQSIGFKPGWFFGGFATIAESVGGLMLITGFLTQFAALMLMPVMAGAFIFNIRQSKKFFGEPELNIILLFVLLLLATLGSGAFSLDLHFGLLF